MGPREVQIGVDLLTPTEFKAKGVETFMLHAQHSEDSQDSADVLSASIEKLPAIDRTVALGAYPRNLSTQQEDAREEEVRGAGKAEEAPVTTEFFLIETGNRNVSLAKVVTNKTSNVPGAMKNA